MNLQIILIFHICSSKAHQSMQEMPIKQRNKLFKNQIFAVLSCLFLQIYLNLREIVVLNYTKQLLLDSRINLISLNQNYADFPRLFEY